MLTQIKGLITNNWMAKLFCLLFALSLWGWVKVQQTAEENFEVQVNFRNLPDDFVVTQDSDEVVSVTLSGPKTTLNRTDASEVQVEIDASQFDPGENSVRILPWNLEYPRGLTIESIQPPRVNVFLERRTDKTVQLDANVSEPPPEGFEYDVTVSPDSAVVRGSAMVLEDISQIDLEPVDLSNHDTGFVVDGVTAELPEGVDLVRPDTNSFTVRFDVYEPIVTRTISGISVTVLGGQEGEEWILEPSELTLDIRGPRRSIQALEAEDIVAEVRPPRSGESPIREAQVDLPDELELAGGQPDRRAVQIQAPSEQ
jgi:YbbR domain-containing protein